MWLVRQIFCIYVISNVVNSSHLYFFSAINYLCQYLIDIVNKSQLSLYGVQLAHSCVW